MSGLMLGLVQLEVAAQSHRTGADEVPILVLSHVRACAATGVVTVRSMLWLVGLSTGMPMTFRVALEIFHVVLLPGAIDV